MSVDNGPWGARDGTVAPAEGDGASGRTLKQYRLGPVEVRLEKAEAPAGAASRVDKGQHPAWAAISTLLLAGFIWYVSGSWLVAGAVVFGLFVHEFGHVLAMNALGMGPAKIYIVPFVGGLARAQRPAASEWHGVLVSLAGPAFGLLATAPFFVGWQMTGGSAWLVGAFFIAMLNLINLAPAPPLDGSHALGPVLARIHPVLELAVIAAIGAGVVFWAVMGGSWLFAALIGLALFGHIKRGPRARHPRRLTPLTAVFSFGLYLATLAACLAVATVAFLPVAGSMEAALAGGFGLFGGGR